MKKDEWFPFLSSLGLPCAYHHFEEGHSPAPPFLVYWFPASQNYGADNLVYHRGSQVRLELYTEKKDLEIEEKIEAKLDSHSLFFDKEETYLDTEKLYQVIYHLNQ